MQFVLSDSGPGLAALAAGSWLTSTWLFVKVLIGFSIIIFVHELGHFLAAKWAGIRVDRFAIGFGYRLFGWRRGEGFTFGHRPNYTGEELGRRQYGETDYCFKALPIGGYVKMLGQDDIQIDEKSGDVSLTDDPRAFTNRPVGQRMVVVSAGVLFNLLFAAILLMVVYMVGKRVEPAIVGYLNPTSPAATAGLLIGDRVVTVNDKPVRSFKDVFASQILTKGPLRLRVERDGKLLDQELVIARDPDAGEELPEPVFRPPQSPELGSDGEPVDDRPAPKTGDRITHVNGQPIRSAADIEVAFALSAGRVLRLTVERPEPSEPERSRAIECEQRAGLYVFAADALPQDVDTRPPLDHILGFYQRQVVAGVERRSPAAEAGIQPGDVIVQWGTIANPLRHEITENVRAHEGVATPVVVERDGQEVNLTVTPRRPFKLFGSAPPRAGVAFRGNRGEERRPVVADVAPGTPAAALNMPRGALLLEMDGQLVRDWFDVVKTLKAAAGRTIAVRFRAGQDEVVGPMPVPSSIVNELGLPPTPTSVLSIDGGRQIQLPDGKTVALPSMLAVRELLKASIGKTVTVVFTDVPPSTRAITRTFTVRPDNIDPWQMRLIYLYDVAFAPMKEILTADGNPLRALAMGVRETGLILLDVYQALKSIINRDTSVKHVSGPVGIVSHAIDRARAGMVELLFFLAFLSVNLAVINFLPLPVVDGGLMVFLLIEKIKGSPLSVKTQMISTIAGLALIVLVFLLVTIQDVSKLWG